MYSLATKKKTEWFINTYGKLIIDSIKGTNIFFPAAVAQRAIESGYGKSKLATLYNNYGGVKCNQNLSGAIGCGPMPTNDSKNGVLYKTTGNFTKFKDVPSGMFGCTDVLMKDRYKNARLNAKSAKEQILMISRAGYGGVTPELYLAGMAGIIEAAQDYTGLGRID